MWTAPDDYIPYRNKYNHHLAGIFCYNATYKNIICLQKQTSKIKFVAMLRVTQQTIRMG